MISRLKLKCPLCGLTHFCGDLNEPIKKEFDQPHLPEILVVKVTSRGSRGGIVNHMTDIHDFEGERAEEIEKEILVLMKKKAEYLIDYLDLRLKELRDG